MYGVIYLLMYSFSRYFLRTYYILGTMLHTEDIVLGKMDLAFTAMKAAITIICDAFCKRLTSQVAVRP